MTGATVLPGRNALAFIGQMLRPARPAINAPHFPQRIHEFIAPDGMQIAVRAKLPVGSENSLQRWPSLRNALSG
jgi:hypothetical protein